MTGHGLPRVLLVDDDERIRYVHGRVLRGAGFEVIEARTGEAALRLLQAAGPTLIVCDVHLPDIDGFAVCRWVRGHPTLADTPFMFVSATRMTDRDRVRGLDSGADAYMIEPVPPELLVATVRSLMRPRQTAERLQRLQEATSELSGAATPADVAAVLLRHAIRAVGARHGIVALADPEATRLEVAARAGTLAELLAAGAHAVETEAPLALCEAFRDGAPVAVRLTDGRRALGGEPPPDADGLALAMPVAYGARRLGALQVFADRPREEIDREDMKLLGTLVEQAAQALERAQLLQRAQLQREAARRGRVRAQLLGEVGARLDAVRGQRKRAEALLQLLVPRVARFAEIALVAEGETRLTVARGQASDAGAEPPVVLPLHVGSARLGRLSVAIDRSAWTADDIDDPAFLQALAERAALSLQNARLWERASEIALELQQSLLSAPPRVSGTAVAVRYVAAEAGLEVGGDWYDAIDLPHGALGVAVGDVVGRGLRAAAAMGQLRSGMSAMALTAAGPGELLERLDDFASSVPGGRLATAAYAVVDPSSGELRYAYAGHPPALLLPPEGPATFLEGGRSGSLGGLAVRPRPEERLVMAPGGRLVLYTDGLVERRREIIDRGLARLAAAAERHRELDLEAFCDALIADLVGEGGSPDDVAVVCVELEGRPAARMVSRIPPDPSALASLRRSLADWLREQEVPEDQLAEVLLAVGEACANAVEHAYRGVEAADIGIDLRLERDGRLLVRVRDGGRWRQVPSTGDRGRGIEIMRKLADRIEIETGRAGTLVSIEKRIGRDSG